MAAGVGGTAGAAAVASATGAGAGAAEDAGAIMGAGALAALMAGAGAAASASRSRASADGRACLSVLGASEGPGASEQRRHCKTPAVLVKVCSWKVHHPIVGALLKPAVGQEPRMF